MKESIKYLVTKTSLSAFILVHNQWKHPWSKSVDFTIQSLELDGTWNIEMQ